MVKRNYFKLDEAHFTTGDIGMLIPVYNRIFLPHTKGTIVPAISLRLRPLVRPLLSDLDVSIHYFKVNLRDIWQDFEDFIVGKTVGIPPTMSVGLPLIRLLTGSDNPTYGDISQTLVDYLGFPNCNWSSDFGMAKSFDWNLFYLNAFNHIYNTFYRDSSEPERVLIQESIDPSNFSKYKDCFVLPRANLKKDYFTSALTSPQNGAPVLIPTSKNYQVDNLRPQSFVSGQAGSLQAPVVSPGGGSATGLYNVASDSSGAEVYFRGAKRAQFHDKQAKVSFKDYQLENLVPMNDGSATIFDLWNAIATQKFLTLDARSGNDYEDFIRREYGARVKNSHINLPVHIGKVKVPFQLGAITQDVAGSEDYPIGSQAGKGGASAYTTRPVRFTTDQHCIIMGIMQVLPKRNMYGNAQIRSPIDNIKSRFDFYSKEFANIGDDAIYKQELSILADKPDDIFGYKDRYVEWRTSRDRQSGFCSLHGQELIQANFGKNPVLNYESRKWQPYMVQGIFATDNEAQGQMAINSVHAVRVLQPVSKFSRVAGV